MPGANVVWLSEGEEDAMLREVAKDGARNELLLRLLVRTGIRQGEAAPLVARDFDLNRGALTVRKIEIPRAYTPKKKVTAAGWGKQPISRYKEGREITILDYDNDGLTGDKHRIQAKNLGKEPKAFLIRTGLKAGHEVRTIPIRNRALLAELREWCEGLDPAHFVFRSNKGGMLGPTMIHRIAARAILRAGCDPVKAHPHALRHTFAIRFLRARRGSDLAVLQRLMGHASLATTAKYLQFIIEDLEDAMKRAEDEGLR